jgi:methylmalonyl-CoA mutase
MNQKSETKPLLNEFTVPTPEQWREAAEKLLKGAPFDKIMTRMTPEGIKLEPIFWQDVLDQLPASDSLPGFDGFLRGTKAAGYAEEPWEIAQELPYGLPYEFNQAARADLMRGQNALNVILDIATLKGFDPDAAEIGDVGACGLSLACLKDMQIAFDGILPDAIRFHIRSGSAGLTVGALFFAWLDSVGADRKTIRGSLGMDPMAVKAASGVLPESLSGLYDEMSVLARYCAQEAPGMRAITVSTLPYHQGGASSVEEIAIALATGTLYLNAMLERGLDIETAARQIRFSIAIGPNFFMEIAKIRALRTLWSQVVKAYGGSAAAQKILLHARTGLYNKTVNDPYVNMLRTTTEALSAVIAGVDSLCIGNFDEVVRLPDTFSRRISRNTHVILQEECELLAVTDPAGGSWAIEWLTDQVARKSWGLFQEIESAGGASKALASGMLQERIEKTATANEAQLNQRRSSLVGTNVYPNSSEQPLAANQPDYKELRNIRAKEIAQARLNADESADARIMAALGGVLNSTGPELMQHLIEAIKAGATLGEISKTLRAQAEPDAASRPLRSRRLATQYEALRAASARFAEKTGSAPAIFLCNFGPLRRHKARADFTRGFFATGGFKIISSKGFANPEQAVAALSESKAGITVVCGHDDDYATSFCEYAQAIKAALPDVQIILAGNPGEREDEYRSAGMDDYIFVKSDNYAVNRSYLTSLGIL